MRKSKKTEPVHEMMFLPHRADPYLVLGPDGKYYFTATVPEYDRIVIRCAETIRGLREAEETTVWTRHEDGPQSFHIWAPELHFLDGAWYLYYAAGEKRSHWKIRPYVLRCKGKDPCTDGWEELGMLQPAEEDVFSFQSFSLDATVFLHKGEKYMVWAEKVGVGKKVSNLYIARMESPQKLATAQVLLCSPDYAWERVGFWVNEGPALLHGKDKLYLTYSASFTGACYCMGMLSIDADADLLDPRAWKKERYPVLCSDPSRNIFGPGHNSFVKDTQTGEDLCVFHARPEEEIKGNPLYNPNRGTFIMRVAYDGQGRPVFDYNNLYY